MPKSFKGKVQARVVRVRFAIAGKISNTTKAVGDSVKKGELLASLDRKILQTQLDRELADFEKARADFEVFNQKKPEVKSELDKYLKAQKQALLNASVKEVELAKARLDRCSLASPVDGVVLDDSSIVKGLNITPSFGSIKVIDTSSFCFEIVAAQKDISYFDKERSASVKIVGVKETFKGKTQPIVSDGKRLFVHIPLTSEGLFLGLDGKASF